MPPRLHSCAALTACRTIGDERPDMTKPPSLRPASGGYHTSRTGRWPRPGYRGPWDREVAPDSRRQSLLCAGLYQSERRSQLSSLFGPIDHASAILADLAEAFGWTSWSLYPVGLPLSAPDAATIHE